MSPIDAIIWTCVLLFAAVSVIMILHIVGLRRIEPPHANILFKILVVQIVTASAGAFAHYTYQEVRKRTPSALPLDQTLIVEDGSPLEAMDGDKPLYIQSPDVHLCWHKVKVDGDDKRPCEKQFAELLIATNREMTGATKVCLETSTTQDVRVEGVEYSLSYRDIGKLWPRIDEPNADAHDFILLAMSRESSLVGLTGSKHDLTSTCPQHEPRSS